MTAADVNVDVVTVDAVTAAVIVDGGSDVLPAVIVHDDDDADASAVVTMVLTVDAMLQLIYYQ